MNVNTSETLSKDQLFRQVIAQLERDCETLERAAAEAIGEATHAESKPENKYDTRGLEASYLAAGQGRRALELRENIGKLKQLPLATRDTVGPGSLVAVTSETSLAYFVLPFVGGVDLDDGRVRVVSTVSPLGQLLLGKGEGDDVTFNGRSFEILSVR